MASNRWRNFVDEILRLTPFFKLILLLVVLWLIFGVVIYFAERAVDSTAIESFGDALYWGIAAFSTAGIANMPEAGLSKLFGGLWIIVGSVMYFGIIVGTVTAYFMRPLQRPSNQLIDAVEYNLEQLEELSTEELDLLRETVDGLIEHMEAVRERRDAS